MIEKTVFCDCCREQIHDRYYEVAVELKYLNEDCTPYKYSKKQVCHGCYTQLKILGVPA